MKEQWLSLEANALCRCTGLGGSSVPRFCELALRTDRQPGKEVTQPRNQAITSLALPYTPHYHIFSEQPDAGYPHILELFELLAPPPLNPLETRWETAGKNANLVFLFRREVENSDGEGDSIAIEKEEEDDGGEDVEEESQGGQVMPDKVGRRETHI